jgi:hypothetical protein
MSNKNEVASTPAEGANPRIDESGAAVTRVRVQTRKYEKLEAVIDTADLSLVQGHRLNWSPGRPGREIAGGSLVLVIDGSPKPLARVILMVTDPEVLVSHVNGNRLDCRRANLVLRSRSQVALLRKPSSETVARHRPYPDPNRAGVWRIPLRGYMKQREALVDQADLPIVEGKNWNWSSRTEDGRTEGTVVLATTGRQLPLHRLIMNVTDPKIRVSFVNGDALDCRRENLIVRTNAELCSASRKMLTRAGTKCSSRFKGVSRDEQRGTWIAQIRTGRVYTHIGRFESEVEGARAYDAAARVRFGMHAYLNFPDEASTEATLSIARSAMEADVARTRLQRQRQRHIERELRRAAAGSHSLCEPHDDVTMISEETARQLFDVSPTVWARWKKFGWTPAYKCINGELLSKIDDVERLLRRCGIIALPYQDPDRPDTYRVPLSGETAKGREALIDADSVPLVQTRRWRFAEAAVGRGGEVQCMIPGDNIRLHYIVMGITSSANEFNIGHRNDDPLDCRRENLVVRTLTETHANHRKQATFCGRPCTSRFKGVHWEKRRKHWVATIKKNGVQRRLGSFGDEIAAAQAYDEAAREWFGEHARLNFRDGIDAWLEREAQAQAKHKAA